MLAEPQSYRQNWNDTNAAPQKINFALAILDTVHLSPHGVPDGSPRGGGLQTLIRDSPPNIRRKGPKKTQDLNSEELPYRSRVLCRCWQSRRSQSRSHHRLSRRRKHRSAWFLAWDCRGRGEARPRRRPSPVLPLRGRSVLRSGLLGPQRSAIESTFRQLRKSFVSRSKDREGTVPLQNFDQSGSLYSSHQGLEIACGHGRVDDVLLLFWLRIQPSRPPKERRSRQQKPTSTWPFPSFSSESLLFSGR